MEYDNGPVASDNKANLYALGYKHWFGDNQTAVYLVYARLKNGYWARIRLMASASTGTNRSAPEMSVLVSAATG